MVRKRSPRSRSYFIREHLKTKNKIAWYEWIIIITNGRWQVNNKKIASWARLDISWTEIPIIVWVLRSVRWPGAGAGDRGGGPAGVITCSGSGASSGQQWLSSSLSAPGFIAEIIFAGPRPAPGSAGEDKLCCHLWLWQHRLVSSGHKIHHCQTAYQKSIPCRNVSFSHMWCS